MGTSYRPHGWPLHWPERVWETVWMCEVARRRGGFAVAITPHSLRSGNCTGSEGCFLRKCGAQLRAGSGMFTHWEHYYTPIESYLSAGKHSTISTHVRVLCDVITSNQSDNQHRLWASGQILRADLHHFINSCNFFLTTDHSNVAVYLIILTSLHELVCKVSL